MRKTNLKIIYSSHLSQEENETFERHVRQTVGVDHNIYSYVNHNEFSLTEIYNTALHEHRSENSILVFLHNDIEFDTINWGRILLKHFNNPSNDYQILGVAGSVELYEHGCWWLTQDKKSMNMSAMVGVVNHDNGLRKWTSQYSLPHIGVKPVILVDGLFMAVDVSSEGIESEFIEDYKGFHFYDVSFCVENYLRGCNIGVITDIRITHKSIGQTNEQWELNRQQFAEEYKADLPIFLEE